MAKVRPTPRSDVQFVHIIDLAPRRLGTEGTFGQYDVGGCLAVRLASVGEVVVVVGVVSGRWKEIVGPALGEDGFVRNVEGVVVTGDEYCRAALG